ncbi:Leucine Rich repeats (2 copies) [Gemmata sp. SH-PL17]|uniref:TIGR02996 domain-containing protein n=1 Tax=Gemmata sp. SH-PL17 TaxID=1630693 RepID=UPI00078B7D9F|nr:TIGR02996 domain-containing protein [Gemmata sp. SH-PL17]AMV29301.1 Leucine Rich repeats (2 copies) [Gemmata sp. SH-PL17]
MTDDESALLGAIAANPDDDTPRLVYADWLDEHGRHERAEFIRVQIELARAPNHPDHLGLRAREAKLLEAHEQAWAPNNALCLFFKWRRGFVATLHPAARGVFGGEDSLKLLAEFPLAEELEIGFCMTDAEFRHLPVLPNLRSLTLGGNVRLTNDAIRRVGKLRTLHRLRLSLDRLTDACLAYLAGLTELRHLDISYSEFTDAGLQHIIKLHALEELDLSNTHISGRNLSVLGALPRLRKLNLTDTNYFHPGIGGLSACRSLEELRLGSHYALEPIAETDVAVLQGLPHLRVLDLGAYGEMSEVFLASVRERLPGTEVRYAGLTYDAPGPAT